MGKVGKETVSYSVRIRESLLNSIDERVNDDPRFCSRAEFVTFCIQQAYGEVLNNLCRMMESTEKGPSKEEKDSELVDLFIKEAKEIASYRSVFDSYGGNQVNIQIRISIDLQESIDVICELISAKKTDFIKYSILAYGFSDKAFALNKCTGKGEIIFDSEMNVKAASIIDLSPERMAFLSDKVLEGLTSNLSIPKPTKL